MNYQNASMPVISVVPEEHIVNNRKEYQQHIEAINDFLRDTRLNPDDLKMSASLLRRVFPYV